MRGSAALLLAALLPWAAQASVHCTNLGGDSDGDGICNLGGPVICANGLTTNCRDNCPATPNPDQANGDDLLAGDACQCGDVSLDTGVDILDVVLVERHLADRTSSTPFDAARCSVAGPSTDCNANDASTLRQHLAALSPSTLKQVCVESSAVCGNGILEGDESCDDGNLVSGDGCSSTCTREEVPIVQSKDQQKCIVELNKGFQKVAKAQGKHQDKCIKNGAKGKLAPSPSKFEACIADSAAFGKDKVFKAESKTISKAADKCRPPPEFPDFAATDPLLVNEVAKAAQLALVHDLFGPDLDAVILEQDGETKSASKCQVDVSKQVNKCVDAQLKAFSKCKKDGLKGKLGSPVSTGSELVALCMDDPETHGIADPKGKITKACETKLVGKINKKCGDVGGIPLSSIFPGLCSNAAGLGELAECLRSQANCQVCVALNQVDSLDRDCDDFDDGDPSNGSCSSCGNGVLDRGEACDDGNLVSGDGCNSLCDLEFCSDELVQGALGETCDDGNLVSGDGCDANCSRTACGNGIRTALESCDDGNLVSGDGCGAGCVSECGNGQIDGLEQCDDENVVDGDGCDSNCTSTTCGNGIRTLGEHCDDGNLTSGDGCSFSCLFENCGDGLIQLTLGEECDDGDQIDGDGCDSNCRPTGCGNGIETLGEGCDDGNLIDGDGCSATCISEDCGDGQIQAPAEECDDGNLVDGDGCDSNCLETRCGNGVTALDEECDDGNLEDLDGCSSLCRLEVCGDGIVQETRDENCDPPGSVCREVGVCGDDCRCIGPLGRFEAPLNVAALCTPMRDNIDPIEFGVPAGCADGSVPESCSSCTDHVTHRDCPGEAGDFRCIGASNSQLNTALSEPQLSFNLDGPFVVECGTVDPVTQSAPCTCDILALEPVNLTGIGFVCFTQVNGAEAGCSTGRIDCAGGGPADVEMFSDHDVGPEVFTNPLDPNFDITRDFPVPFCGLLDPNDGNGECDRMCDKFCKEVLPPEAGYRVELASCEGYCQAGGREDKFCEFDIDCPDGSCAGKDPVGHRNICGCDCFRVVRIEDGGGISRPGAISCEPAVRIVVEAGAPCGIGDDVIIDLPEKCVPMTTELASGRIESLNTSSPEVVLIGPDLMGTPANCEDLDNGIIEGLQLNGHITFFDSNIGDLQTTVSATLLQPVDPNAAP